MTLRQLLGELAFAPFVLGDRLRQRAAVFRARGQANLAATAKLLPGARIINIRRDPTAISVGANTTVGGDLVTFAHGGRIEIGDWCYLGEHSRVWSAESVRIGSRVLVAHDVNIHDNNSHPTDPALRHQHFRDISERGHPSDIASIRSAPVTIEDDVWIGFGSVVLKGVRIGARSIIAAQSVVTSDVPSDVVFAGNKIVKELEQ